MKKFNSLEKGTSFEQEEKINKYWDKINILKKTIDNRSEDKSFIFFEGPPTANNLPGIHHVISRNLKDSICKYKTMKGFKVQRKAGWDTHGLPVEIEVELLLRCHPRSDIVPYAIKKLNKK